MEKPSHISGIQAILRAFHFHFLTLAYIPISTSPSPYLFLALSHRRLSFLLRMCALTLATLMATCCCCATTTLLLLLGHAAQHVINSKNQRCRLRQHTHVTSNASSKRMDDKEGYFDTQIVMLWENSEAAEVALGVIIIPILIYVTTACAKRTGAAARESLRRDHLAGSRRLRKRQSFSRMHTHCFGKHW